MAKNPYLKFYIGDYIKDTKRLPLNVRGGWVELILAMWENDPKGEIIGDMEEYARTMSCSVDEAFLVIQILKQRRICDFEEFEDGRIKMISRKQKDMIKLSQKRSEVGKLGGNPGLLNQNDVFLLNQKDNLNHEYEYISSNDIDSMNTLLASYDYMPGRKNFSPVFEKMMEVFLLKFSGYFRDDAKDQQACEVIAANIEKIKGWAAGSSLNGHLGDLLAFWSEVVDYIAGDKWLRTRALSDLSTKEWQRLGQHMAKRDDPDLEKKKKDSGLSDYQKELAEKREKAKNRKA